MRLVICLQIPTNVRNVSDIRRIEIHTAEPSPPCPKHPEVEIAIAELQVINRQLMIKFLQNFYKPEVIYRYL
jgi:hypothetical protein